MKLVDKDSSEFLLEHIVKERQGAMMSSHISKNHFLVPGIITLC